jgi:hypothetical protein
MTTPCSDASRAREEPLAATASRVARWLLVEQCGPWGPPSLPTARMPQALAQHLTAEAARMQARLVLLRHPPGIECPPGRAVLVVDSAPGRERVRRRTFLDDDALAATTLPGPHDDDPAWTDDGEPLLLACTHGRHDRCCAVRGRPVALALSQHWPGRTWECSHIGGDRFAANVVVLPAGHYLGRLEVDRAVDQVADLLAGHLPLDVHRGRSSLTLPVQAAQSFAREALSRSDADDLAPASQVGDGADAWRVRLAGSAGRPDVEVRVRLDRGAPPQLLTCGATVPQAAPAFRCERLV